MNKSPRRVALSAWSILLAGSLVACQANPGPAPVEDVPPATQEGAEATTEPPTGDGGETTEATETTEPPAAGSADDPITTGRSQVNIGIDPLRNGFNPHLLADDSTLVQDIATLVLPSTFVGNLMNTDLLEDVATVEPPSSEVAQTVRYTLRQEAQWSDGTPITGSDFAYLHRSIVDTPGTFNRAGYEAITAIRTSGGGKVVEVDFSTPVANWQQLFNNLLPSHLIQGLSDGFRTGLHDAIPAAGGRYMVRSIDRQRGMVTLARNDRFWGANPATIELLSFHGARSTSRAGEFLRTGQSVFMNLRPTETLVDTFRLVPGVEVRTSDTDRALRVVLNTASPALATPARRAGVLELIDVPLTARLATGRSATLSVAPATDYRVEGEGGETGETGEADAREDLRELTAESPLRFAIDPADDQAVAAGRVVVDQLAAAGINAVTVSTDMTSMLGGGVGGGLAAGEYDGVILRSREAQDSLSLAETYGCELSLSGWCDGQTEDYLEQLMAGEIGFDPEWGRRLNEEQALHLPIVIETRVEARTPGIVGPTGDPSSWPGGIASAANWRKNDIEQ